MATEKTKYSRYKIKPIYLILADIFGISASLIFSIVIRYEVAFGLLYRVVPALPYLVIALVVRIWFYQRYGIYRQLWRHASIEEFKQIIKSVTYSSLLLALINILIFQLLNIPFVESEGVLIIDWFLNLAWLGGSRMSLRIGLSWLVAHRKQNVLEALQPKQRILIIGAGDTGSTVIRWMRQNPELGYQPIGFVDDDPGKRNHQMYGLPVLGDRDDIPTLVKQYEVDEIIVAMPTASQPAVDTIREICEQTTIPFRVIPSIYDLLGGTLSVAQMRQWRPLQSRGQDPIVSDVNTTIKNILVTGGAGFIGSNFVRYMLEKYPDYKIVVYDKLTYAGNPENLKGLDEQYGERYAFIHADICEYKQVECALETYQIDAIVNFAAETHVDRSLMNPDSFLTTNVYGTYVLLEAAKNNQIARFHQVSTDEVYGQVLRGSFSEDDPLETRSPYSASKAAADLLVHAYYASFDIFTTITRGSNNIGPYQYPEKAVPLFITNALENKPLPVYGDGLYIRDYQYVIDHCKGIDIVLHRGKPGESYNLGGNNDVSALKLAQTILDVMGKPQNLIRMVPDRPGNDRRYSLNCSKINALGWFSEWSFERSLNSTIDWYIQNEWWWRKLKSGEYKDYYEKQYRKRFEEAVGMALRK